MTRGTTEDYADPVMRAVTLSPPLLLASPSFPLRDLGLPVPQQCAAARCPPDSPGLLTPHACH